MHGTTRKLLRRFIEANGDQDVAELSRSHITLYLATELGDVRGVKLRPVSVLRHEADMFLDFYGYLARQGFCDPLHPDYLKPTSRRYKKRRLFLSIISHLFCTQNH
jgi:hypothetical protein